MSKADRSQGDFEAGIAAASPCFPKGNLAGALINLRRVKPIAPDETQEGFEGVGIWRVEDFHLPGHAVTIENMTDDTSSENLAAPQLYVVIGSERLYSYA